MNEIKDRDHLPGKITKEITKILIAEQDSSDLELLKRELAQGGIRYVSEVVQNEQSYASALKTFNPDIILADYSFPSFDGQSAFRLKQELARHIPFIIVSGTIGEERSIELIESGVTDYVLKDRLFTLNTKIKRALNESNERQQKERADRELERSEKRYRQIVETAQEGIWLVDENNITILVNRKMADMLEYSIGEMIGKENYFFMHEEEKKKAADHIIDRKVMTNESHEFRYITKSGREVYTCLSTNPLFGDDGKYEGALAMVIDITKRKNAERQMAWLINNTEESFILLNRNLEIISFNDTAQRLYSKYMSRELVSETSILDYAQGSRHNAVKDLYNRVLEGSEETSEITMHLQGSDIKNFEIKYKPARDEQDRIIGVFVSGIDITEKKKAGAQREFERRDKEALINTTNDLIWSVSNDFTLIAANRAFLDSLREFIGVELRPGDELLMKDKVTPEYLNFWKGMYAEALSGKAFTKEIYFAASGNRAEAWTEINFNPIYDNDLITGVACYSSNKTAAKNFQTELINSNKKLAAAQQIANLGYWEMGKDATSFYWSDEVYNIWGVSANSFKISFDSYYQTIHPDDRGRFDQEQKDAVNGKGKMDIEYRIILPTGKVKCIHQRGEIVYDDQEKIIRMEGTVQDITERKELQNLLNKASKLARIGSWEVDLIKGTLYWSDITKEIHETEADYKPDLASATGFCKPGRDRELLDEKMNDAIKSGSPWDEELQIITGKGNTRWIRSIGEAELLNGMIVRINGSLQDIDTRKRNEMEVTEVMAEKNVILESIDDAFFAVDKNWTVTYWNTQAEKVLGKSKGEILGQSLWEVFSDSVDSESYRKYHQAVETAQSVHFEDFYPALTTWYEISAYPSANGLSVYCKNVSERKLSEMRLTELNEDLQMQAKQLALSNAELERFAYVASHDLQEPLRMITSFLTQLERKYSKVIDEKGRQYIGFAVDGAKRMRQIILDLLEFSKAGRTEELAENLDLNELLEDIKVLYRKKIEDKDSVIEAGNLPVIQAYRSPLLQVFQNLISNSLKYSRKDIKGRISITSEEHDDHWKFAVSDNGIGIASEYFDRIFIIFQRLHNKDEYSGTGMGLAITKKIVESQGGKIWLESEEGIGSTFYFTIKRYKEYNGAMGTAPGNLDVEFE